MNGKIKKGDTVEVIAPEFYGCIGEVIAISGINVIVEFNEIPYLPPDLIFFKDYELEPLA